MPTVIKNYKEFHQLKTTHFNAQGLVNKLASFCLFVAENDYDIIAVSETWFDNTILDSEVTPSGYDCYRKDRDLSFYPEGTYVDKSKGGVAFFVKNSLQIEECLDMAVAAQILWIKLILNCNQCLLLGVAYRPDKGGLDCMSKICESMYKIDTTDVVLFGDFNARDIDWNYNTSVSAIGNTLLTAVDDNLLIQLVKNPTHGHNILDLIFTGNYDIIDRIDVAESVGKSDHLRTDLMLKIMLPRRTQQNRVIYLYSKCDHMTLNEEIGNINWMQLFEGKSLNQK